MSEFSPSRVAPDEARGERAEAVAARQPAVGGQVDAVERRSLVHVAQHREVVDHGHGTRHVAGRVPLHGIDVVVDARVVGRDDDAPALVVGRVPVGGDARSACDLRLQLDVAEVAVAVANEVVHERRHLPGRPGVALVEVRRPGLLRQAEFVGLDVRWREARESTTRPSCCRTGHVIAELNSAASRVWLPKPPVPLVGNVSRL